MPPTDTFSHHQEGLSAPCRNVAAVTPNDSVDLPTVARELSVNESGLVVVDMLGEGSSVSVFIAAGAPKSGRFTKVHATGTTATGIVRWW